MCPTVFLSYIFVIPEYSKKRPVLKRVRFTIFCRIKERGFTFSECVFVTVSQRSPEIIVHRECAVEGGRRNVGRKVSTQLPRPKTEERALI
jgi:hypothetical protein